MDQKPTIEDIIRRHMRQVCELTESAVAGTVQAVELLRAARERGARVFTIGNGGSASTASHFANDLTKMCGMRAECLADHVPAMLAYGNDSDWDEMFAGQLENNFRDGDVLVAVSCGGRSTNVRGAEEEALELGGDLLILTGDWEMNVLPCPVESGRVVTVLVGEGRITVQEDAHLAVCHAIVEALKENG